MDMESFNIDGIKANNSPKLVSRQQEISDKKSILDIFFETNPLDGQCDQRVRMSARPLDIVYDAVSIT